MTDPNSASPQPVDSSSASLFVTDKLMYVGIYSIFWFNIVMLSNSLANWGYGVPRQFSISSAFSYLWSGLLLLSISGGLKMPSWSALSMMLCAASVLLLKYDSWMFAALNMTLWSIACHNLVGGNLFPWSRMMRHLFARGPFPPEGTPKSE